MSEDDVIIDLADQVLAKVATYREALLLLGKVAEEIKRQACEQSVAR